MMTDVATIRMAARCAGLASIIGLTSLAISACNPTTHAEVPPAQNFSVKPTATALMEPAAGSPWSGLWSVEGTSLDSEMRVTHLGHGVHAVEGISSINTLLLGTATDRRLFADEGGKGNRIELAYPVTGDPCVQGWQKPPSTDPVPMVACRVR